jgi:hypothetical protein
MVRKSRKTRTSDDVGIAKGFRSGLEDAVGDQIRSITGSAPEYESIKIEYVKPARKAKYTPDWVLPNGIIIETKGRFETDDRQKHILIKEQHPEHDIRFVFSRSKAPIRKGSKTTYADWCKKNGFKYSDKLIPPEWFNE